MRKLLRIALALGRAPGSKASRSTAHKAAALYHAGDVDYVLVSGRWSVREVRQLDTTEAADMYACVLKAGVPPERILLEDQARDTMSNITESQKVLDSRGLHPAVLLIVTIPYAQWRAVLCARRVWPRGQCIIGITSDYALPNPGARIKLIAQEMLLLTFTWLSLLGVQGDIAAIQRRLQYWHPGYRSGVASPIKLL